MVYFIQVVVIGLGIGLLYGIVGVSFTAIYNATQVINFAQGTLMMVGAVMTGYLTMNVGASLPVIIVAVVFVSIFLGLVISYVVVGPLVKKGQIVMAVVATLSFSYIVEGLVGILTEHHFFRVPSLINIRAISVGGVRIAPTYVVVLGITLLMTIAYWVFSKRTRHGIALRGVGVDSETISMLGIRGGVLVAMAFVISALMGGLGGLFASPILTPHAGMAFPLLLKGFVAAIIGGLGNPYAPLVGGMILGVIEMVVASYSSAAFGEIITFLILMGVLILMPEGLAGKGEE